MVHGTSSLLYETTAMLLFRRRYTTVLMLLMTSFSAICFLSVYLRAPVSLKESMTMDKYSYKIKSETNHIDDNLLGPENESEGALEMKVVSKLTENKTGNGQDVKLILGYTTLYRKPFPEFVRFQDSFTKCPDKCEWTTNKSDFNRSDGVIFHLYSKPPGVNRQGEFRIIDLPVRLSNSQKWILMSREPSAFFYPQQLKKLNDMFNLTMTYQLDSDITIPYGTFIPLSPQQKIEKMKKTKKVKKKGSAVAWLVSNCVTSSRRERYVSELQKHIKIDTDGLCFGKERDHSISRRSLAKHYNFYLAFENSDCDDYITEKFWQSLIVGLIPIVRGQRINYTKLAPPRSFIHADEFQSPKHLAQALKKISSNIDLLREYHQWRKLFKIVFITDALCELCAKVHRSQSQSVDIHEHFSKDNRCFTYDQNETGEVKMDIVS